MIASKKRRGKQASSRYFKRLIWEIDIERSACIQIGKIAIYWRGRSQTYDRFSAQVTVSGYLIGMERMYHDLTEERMAYPGFLSYKYKAPILDISLPFCRSRSCMKGFRWLSVVFLCEIHQAWDRHWEKAFPFPFWPLHFEEFFVPTVRIYNWYKSLYRVELSFDIALNDNVGKYFG